MGYLKFQYSSSYSSCIPSPLLGNRGLTMLTLNGSNDYTTANWATAAASRVDETYYETTNHTDHVTRLSGAFVAPETGTFRFYLKAKGSSRMNLTDPVTGTELVRYLWFRGELGCVG